MTRSSASSKSCARDGVALAAAAEDRGLVADVGQVGAGEAARLLGDDVQVDVLAQRLVGACARAGSARGPSTSGGETKTWRSKRPGRSSAGSSFSSRLEAAMTTTRPSAAEAKPSISTSSWLSVCSRSELLSEPRRAPTASSSSMKMIAGCVLARLAEQAADARGAEAGEHLDERGRRLREELRARLVGDGLGQQRLAGAGRAVEQDALGHLGAEALELLGRAQEVDDLAQLGLGLVDAGDVLPADLEVGLGLDLRPAWSAASAAASARGRRRARP